MCKVRDMIDALASDDFDGARVALKASLADYMSGRAYVSNSDLFGKDYKDDYANPNVEDELKMVADLNGGEIRKHDKTGAREEVEEENEYERQMAMKKKKLRNNHYDDLEESVKAKKQSETKKAWKDVDPTSVKVKGISNGGYGSDATTDAYVVSAKWKNGKKLSEDELWNYTDSDEGRDMLQKAADDMLTTNIDGDDYRKDR